MDIEVKNWMKSNSVLMIILCLLISLMVVISVSYAAFMGSGYKKGVVTTTPVGVKFSSNYLESISDKNNIQEYIVSIPIKENQGTDSEIGFNLYIMNTAQEDPSNPSKQDITYDLKIEIDNKDGNLQADDFSIYESTVNENTFTETGNVLQATILNQELKGREVNKNKYVIKMPFSKVEDVEMTITATPTGSIPSELGNSFLARKLEFATYIPGQNSDFVWTGKIIEGDKSEESSALNYELSGFGKGEVTISWDTDKFEIDPFLVVGNPPEKPEVTTEGEKSSITMKVNSEEKGYYQIQFYRIKEIAKDEDVASIFSIDTKGEEGEEETQ